MELSLGVIFRGFNASRVVLYSSLLVFVVLLALKLDDELNIRFTFVFLPLWFCHLIVFLGATVACISYCIKPPSRNEVSLQVDFIAMLLTAAEHIFLCAFVSLCYVKLELASWFDVGYQLPWILVFAPLFALSAASILISIWALRHDKNFEAEFLYAVNIIQMVFLSFKVEKQLDWSWAVVFSPLWVVLSLSTVAVLYALILSIVISRSRHLMMAQRPQQVYTSLLHTALVVPTLIFLVLLTGKLDSLEDPSIKNDMSYSTIFLPLIVSLIILTITSIGIGSGSANAANNMNIWWFGLRQPFCPFLLDTCPSLQQYANVSYRLGGRSRTTASEVRTDDEATEVIVSQPTASEDCVKKTRNDKRKSTTTSDTGGIDGSNTVSIASAINAYKNEYGYLWNGNNMVLPD